MLLSPEPRDSSRDTARSACARPGGGERGGAPASTDDSQPSPPRPQLPHRLHKWMAAPPSPGPLNRKQGLVGHSLWQPKPSNWKHLSSPRHRLLSPAQPSAEGPPAGWGTQNPPGRAPRLGGVSRLPAHLTPAMRPPRPSGIQGCWSQGSPGLYFTSIPPPPCGSTLPPGPGHCGHSAHPSPPVPSRVPVPL